MATMLDDQSSLNLYQRLSRKTYREIEVRGDLIYPTLGLVSEAGELAGKIKKIFRDKDGRITDHDREGLKLEIGDCLWYLAQIATNLDLRLSEVADANLIKILSRLQKGLIGGSGDHRESEEKS